MRKLLFYWCCKSKHPMSSSHSSHSYVTQSCVMCTITSSFIYQCMITSNWNAMHANNATSDALSNVSKHSNRSSIGVLTPAPTASQWDAYACRASNNLHMLTQGQNTSVILRHYVNTMTSSLQKALDLSIVTTSTNEQVTTAEWADWCLMTSQAEPVQHDRQHALLSKWNTNACQEHNGGRPPSYTPCTSNSLLTHQGSPSQYSISHLYTVTWTEEQLASTCPQLNLHQCCPIMHRAHNWTKGNSDALEANTQSTKAWMNSTGCTASQCWWHNCWHSFLVPPISHSNNKWATIILRTMAGWSFQDMPWWLAKLHSKYAGIWKTHKWSSPKKVNAFNHSLLHHCQSTRDQHHHIWVMTHSPPSLVMVVQGLVMQSNNSSPNPCWQQYGGAYHCPQLKTADESLLWTWHLQTLQRASPPSRAVSQR